MIAEIIINNNSRALDKTFDYNIPLELSDKIYVGSRVYVKFGNYKELHEGFVINLKEKSEYKVKDIEKVDNDKLFEEKINLAKWMSKRYFCNLSECIRLMIQPGTTSKNIDNRVKEKCINIIKLNKNHEEIIRDIEILKSEKQIKLLKYLLENGEVAFNELQEKTGITKDIARRLVSKGYIKMVEEQVLRNPFFNKNISRSENLKLTQEQEEAFRQIEVAIDDMMYCEFLLFGVTGSREDRGVFTINRKTFKTRQIKHNVSS
ncbi:MAG: hypothetical protein Q4G05_02480 [Clostridia bacterium]|nr:hypothetical protein [Clostridia bacterium]